MWPAFGILLIACCVTHLYVPFAMGLGPHPLRRSPLNHLLLRMEKERFSCTNPNFLFFRFNFTTFFEILPSPSGEGSGVRLLKCLITEVERNTTAWPPSPCGEGTRERPLSQNATSLSYPDKSGRCRRVTPNI